MSLIRILLDTSVFAVALLVFAYFFDRSCGTDDTLELAMTMHEINNPEFAPEPAKTKAQTAGAA
jgi:hypothetical protein